MPNDDLARAAAYRCQATLLRRDAATLGHDAELRAILLKHAARFDWAATEIERRRYRVMVDADFDVVA
jgi:hypothetical protein